MGCALTNWDQGKLSLEQLLLLLRMIQENCSILGLDIAGDYSPISLEGTLKKFASWLDHPKNAEVRRMPETEITARNERTNLRLLELLHNSFPPLPHCGRGPG